MSENKNDRPKSICVQSEILLYRISDLGLLDKLNGVGINRYKPNKRVWYFDQDKNIQDALDKYRVERKEEREKENG